LATDVGVVRRASEYSVRRCPKDLKNKQNLTWNRLEVDLLRIERLSRPQRNRWPDLPINIGSLEEKVIPSKGANGVAPSA
jgi:hypothetical protein